MTSTWSDCINEPSFSALARVDGRAQLSVTAFSFMSESSRHARSSGVRVLNGPALRALTAKPRKTDMRAEGKVHHSHHPRATRLQPRTINTIGVLCLLEDEEDAIVIVHDGDLHYMCLRRPGEPTSSELPRCLVKGWPASADK